MAASPSHFWRWAIAAGGLSGLLRLRFVFAPIGPDEGGFLAIARAWRHGGDLYGDIWVDRPQGMLILYRVYDMVSFGNEDLVPLLALLFGAVAVVAVAAAVRAVSSPDAGIIAGVLMAVMSSAPAIEGFSANGELLSGTLGALSVAVGCAVLTDRLSGRWMVVCGLLGGCAWSLKQSGIDGPLAIGVWLLVLVVVGWIPRRTAIARLGQFTAGVGAVIGLLALHGWLTGWDDWWYAIVGYRKDQRSALVGAVWDRLDRTWRDALPILLPALVVGIACAIGLVRQRRLVAPSPMVGALLMWPLCALLTFVLGGQFYHHYWVLLTFPVAALAGLFIGALRSARLRVAAVLVALAPAAWSFAGLVTLSDDAIYVELNGHALASRAERVGDWFGENAAQGETLYVLCASAATYAHADADPPFPYLWWDNVRNVPGAVDLLETTLEGEGRPTYVAVFQPGKSCGSERIDDLLGIHYERAAVVDGIAVLRAKG